MIVAALLSAAFACLRNFVLKIRECPLKRENLHDVVFTVKRIYNPIVVTATPAYCHPNLYPYNQPSFSRQRMVLSSRNRVYTSIPETMPISSNVGAI